MQANRSRDTKPEMALRRALHRRGMRYRVCAKPIPSLRAKIDVVFPSARVAVEVRGCFWHGCPDHYRPPTANADYWISKIARNIARDEATARGLEDAGWRLFVIWEHDDLEQAAATITRAVRERRDLLRP